jgi:hypothetical protein
MKSPRTSYRHIFPLTAFTVSVSLGPTERASATLTEKCQACGPPSILITSEKHFTGFSLKNLVRARGIRYP